MSFLTFAKGLFRDTEEIVSLAKVAAATGNRPSNSEIGNFANTIKRSKQTCEDWELFSSLQDIEGEITVENIKTELLCLLQISVQTVKAPTSAAISSIDKQYLKFCTILSKVIGDTETTQIEGLSQILAAGAPSHSNNANNESNQKRNTELQAELKKLAMTALVNLKELSTIVIKSVRTRESTASHFSAAAKTTVQTAQKLGEFAEQCGFQQESSSLNASVIAFINISKEVFIRPVPEGKEQDIVAGQLEKARSVIAVHIREIIQKISANTTTTPVDTADTPKPRISGSEQVFRAQCESENNFAANKEIPAGISPITDNSEPATISPHADIPQQTNSPLQRFKNSTNDLTSSNTETEEEKTTKTEIPESETLEMPENPDNQQKSIEETPVKQEGPTEAGDSESEEKKDKKAKDRCHAFNEIHASEKIYFSNLQFVYWGIMMPLEDESKKPSGIISPTELRNIFSNWQSLMTFNKELFKALEKRRDIPIETRKVGDTFLELVSLMKLYTQFVNNFETSNMVAAKCLERAEFAEFIQKCLESAPNKNLSFQSYLIMPVQRLPRYEMLLRALLKLTGEQHVDYDDLEKAVIQVKSINDLVNQKKRESENRAVVYGIQDKISGFDNLVQAHRLHIRDGELLFSSHANPKKTKKRELFYFYLFNDILLRCKFNKKKMIHEVKESFPLTEYSIRDVTYSPFMSSTERFCFRIVLQRDERTGVSFYASSEQEKSEWFLDVEEAIRNRDAADSSRLH